MIRKEAPTARRANSCHAGGDRSMRKTGPHHNHNIQAKIALSEVQPSSPVSELALAKELGGGTPIRREMGRLVANGLLERSPCRGVMVVKLTRQDIMGLYDLREELESYAAGKVMRQSNRTDVERLQNLADEILSLKDELARSGKAEIVPEQMHRSIPCDLGFHTLLIALAANVRILKVLNETRLLIRVFGLHRRGNNGSELEQIHRCHCEVLRAVSEQDPSLAIRLLSDHIQTSRQERLDPRDHWEREISLRQGLPVFSTCMAGQNAGEYDVPG